MKTMSSAKRELCENLANFLEACAVLLTALAVRLEAFKAAVAKFFNVERTTKRGDLQAVYYGFKTLLVPACEMRVEAIPVAPFWSDVTTEANTIVFVEEKQPQQAGDQVPSFAAMVNATFGPTCDEAVLRELAVAHRVRGYHRGWKIETVRRKLAEIGVAA